MEPSQLLQLQARLQDGLRSLATGGSSVEHVAPTLLQPLLAGAEQPPGRAGDLAKRANLAGVLRRLSLDLAVDAQAKGQPPMQYVAKGASEPALLRLLTVALMCCQQHLLEPVALLTLLEDIQEASVIEHCPDIITWLEQHTSVLAGPLFASNQQAMQQLTRLCNAVLKRLGKHEVGGKARLLMLLASITPLFDRSGVGVTGALAPPDPPKVDLPPADADGQPVDSTGKPVDVLLYTTFWNLQKLLQDPASVLSSADKWATFKHDLTTVLGELSKQPATVPASRAAAAAAVPDADGCGSGDGADAGGTQCYLSSWKLFGLQLTDASFRRDFLVQVLVVLRALLLQGKVPSESLKPKQRMEALALEKEVYRVLESTRDGGKEFCRCIREVLEREATWVAWKKGGKDFVVPGKESDQAAAPGPAGKRPPPVTNCLDWSKPPHASLAEAVQQARAAAAERQRQQQLRHAEGRKLKREADTAGRMYDNNGEPAVDHPAAKRTRYVKLLDGGSSLTLWAQAKCEQASAPPPPLLAGLRVDEQPQYPRPAAVCAQVLRELDPDNGIDREYRRLYEDGLFRWRVGRMVAHTEPPEDGVDGPAKVEAGMLLLLPDAVPEGYRQQLKAEQDARKAEAEARRAERQRPPPQHQPGSGPGRPAAAAAITRDAAAAAAGALATNDAAAAAAKPGGGDDDGGLASLAAEDDADASSQQLKQQ